MALQSKYPAGTRIRFTSEWAGEDTGIYRVVAGDEGTDRLDVVPEQSNLPFPPVETVRVFMVELAN